MEITIPSAVAVFAWIATIWHGRPVLNVPMAFAAAFIVLFVIGGVSGVVTAAVPFDWQVTDTYFVVAHLHYVLIGINLFPVIAGLYYWLPKMTGRMLDTRLGWWNFWTMFVGANLAFFPMHTVGLLGMPRRVFTYQSGLGWDTTNLIISLGAFLFAVGVLLFVVNVIWSLRRGRLAGDNPWDAPTLEWAVSSPPPPYNFAVIPYVGSRHPLWEGRLAEGGGTVLDRGPTLDDGRETLGTTPLDAKPEQVLRMPEDSLVPFCLAVALLVLFYGLLAGVWWLAGAGAVLTFFATVSWLWPTPAATET
jgi:heme/copper-type cytochrome/quinol oxidase subunit 1